MRKLLVLGLLALVASVLFASCGATWPRRDPTGEVFPTVSGNALDGTRVTLPAAAAGEPVLLLVGYKQESQFDIDRWLLALSQSDLRVKVLELPTIPGMFPRMFSGAIDAGMRRGIPDEDWQSVVTLYGDAAPVARFTGNADGLPGRVLLLDREGRVAFFHDRGFSVGTLRRLQEVLAAVR
ncbi:MAG: hypothetical protein RL148_1677 [Planctomycetota bacterium]